MREQALFTPMRECVCCGGAAHVGPKRAGEPNVMAVSQIIYRRGSGKGRSKAARKVNICEECFVRARVGSVLGPNKEAKRLLSAILETLSGCYSTLANEDERAA